MMQLVLIGFAEAKVLCTGENQSPVLIRDGKINVEAMSRCHDVREGSHRRSCGRCVNDYFDFLITVRKNPFDAENVLYGLADRHDHAFNTVSSIGLDVACACTM